MKNAVSFSFTENTSKRTRNGLHLSIRSLRSLNRSSVVQFVERNWAPHMHLGATTTTTTGTVLKKVVAIKRHCYPRGKDLS